MMLSNSPYSPASTIYSPSDSSVSMSSTLPAAHQPRQRLRPWLIDQINSGKIPGLIWLDKEKMIFRIPWKHFGRPGVDEYTDAMLFRLWAKHTKKYQDGEQPDISTWKTRFRCALHKLPDIDELNDLNRTEGDDPYRVYQFKKKEIGNKIDASGSPYPPSVNSPVNLSHVKTEVLGSPYTPASVNSPLSLPQHENPVVFSPMSSFLDMKGEYGGSMQDPGYSQLHDDVDPVQLIQEGGLDLRESDNSEEITRRYMRKRKHHDGNRSRSASMLFTVGREYPYPAWLVQRQRKSTTNFHEDGNVDDDGKREEEETLDVVGRSEDESSSFDNECDDRESKTSEGKLEELLLDEKREQVSLLKMKKLVNPPNNVDLMKNFCNMFASKLERKEDVLQNEDSDEIFGKMIATELKKFPHHLKCQVKHELNNVMYRFQMQQYPIHHSINPHVPSYSVNGYMSSRFSSAHKSSSTSQQRPSSMPGLHRSTSVSDYPSSPAALKHRLSPAERGHSSPPTSHEHVLSPPIHRQQSPSLPCHRPPSIGLDKDQPLPTQSRNHTSSFTHRSPPWPFGNHHIQQRHQQPYGVSSSEISLIYPPRLERRHPTVFSPPHSKHCIEEIEKTYPKL